MININYFTHNILNLIWLIFIKNLSSKISIEQRLQCFLITKPRININLGNKNNAMLYINTIFEQSCQNVLIELTSLHIRISNFR